MSTLSKGSEDSREKRIPFKNFDTDIEEVPIVSHTPLHQHLDLVGEIELKPGEQRRILLGEFSKDKPPKGFSVSFVPEPSPAGSMIAEVNSIGTPGRYKLMLHLANYGIRTVSTEVRQL